MSDKEDPTSPKKSMLKAHEGGKSQKVVKLKKIDLHAMIVDAMIYPRENRWPKFPVKLHRWIDPRGENLVYLEVRGIVHVVADKHIDSLIADYWREIQLDDMSLPTMSAKDAQQIRSLWLITAPARYDNFPLITWASDPRPAHHKLEFDPIPADQIVTPLFDELMGRTSNNRALKAFLGSLFDEKSQRQQYVWIYGSGKNGKGALVRCLSNLFGPVYGSEEAPSGDSKHWTMGLLGKRLVVFADCNNAGFVTSGRFKSLTGEDKIRVEIKNGPVLAVDILAKYLFTSNAKPRISSTTADTRRIIYSHVAPAEILTNDYEERLEKELPAFISACWHEYLLLTNGNPRKEIPTENQDEINELAQDSEHEYEAFVSEYLRFDRDDSGKLKIDPDGKQVLTSLGEMVELMSKFGFKLPYERSQLRQYMLRKHDIRPTKFWNKRTQTRDYAFHGVDILRRQTNKTEP